MQTQKRTVVWLCHAHLGVFVGQHCGARGVQIGVIVRVVEMPVRVDHRLQRRIAQPIERCFQLRPGRQKKRVDHDFAIGPVQHYNVSSGPGKQREIFGQQLRLDRGSTHLRPDGSEMVGWSRCHLLPGAAQKTCRKKLRQQRASRKPGGISQHFAPCALLLQKLGAHLRPPFQMWITVR